MKAFLVFRCPEVPNGGWGDFIGDVHSISEARALLGYDATNVDSDGGFHIVDISGLIPKVVVSGRVVFRENGPKSTMVQFIEESNGQDQDPGLH